MLFKNSSKTLIAQIVLMSFLGAALFLPVTVADAGVTIFLQGQIEPASIDIALDTAALNLDIPTGETTATDTIAVSSTSYIPVEVTLEGVEHISGSWEPTLITGDPTSLEIADAQKKARLSLNLDPPELPPLQDVAREFGVDEIIYTPGNGTSYGFYAWGQNKKQIVLHTHDIKTWFHELGHAVHGTFKEMKAGQNPEQEIVAEVFAAVMCELHGVQEYHAHTWKYVKHYSEEDPKKALQAIFRVLSDVEECLKKVFSIESTLEKEIA